MRLPFSPLSLLLVAIGIAACAAACAVPPANPAAVAPATTPPTHAVSKPDASMAPATAAATTGVQALGMWQPLSGGIEVLRTVDGVSALRHAPGAVRYSTQFQPIPSQGRSVGQWLAADAQALAAVNCGFYRDDNGLYRHIGLLMADGKTLNKLRSGWGGVLVVRNGAAQAVRKPRRLLGPAALGLQGWPMLVEDGARISGLDNTDYSRRTAVGVDDRGRVVWVTAPLGMSLANFSSRLLAKDLALADAVNLDGGASTGLRWRSRAGGPQTGPDSLPLPCAVTLTPAS